MKILLVYPHYPDTFWSFRHALKFIGRKASFPPLGLLTVAAMLPAQWEKKLVDMNVAELTDRDIKWADLVFISAMSIQRESAETVIGRCRNLGVKTVAGGPLFIAFHDQFSQVDHLVLGEAEITLQRFLDDLEMGVPGHIYQDERRADLADTPVPLWELADLRKYAGMNIQYSRGCPFDCEFCDITGLFGRKPRTKQTVQLLVELESLYSRGWRGSIFFVDDNFIGDKQKLKREILPAIRGWMEKRNYPFYFYTEASIDLADDGELMRMMVEAGFQEVFIGIETPHGEVLTEIGKVQNKNRDLLVSVKRIQQAGLQVHGGFIVGFDSDPPTIFDSQIRFIQESGIATAMVGILTALRGTRLYQRLRQEGRLVGDTTGNNMAVSLNFVPRMERSALIGGYRALLDHIYSPDNYYKRVKKLLKEYRPLYTGRFNVQRGYLPALWKSIFFLGVLGKERVQFWNLFFWSLLRKPRLFPLAITYAIYGFHFRKITEKLRENVA
ncbi:B12-binding domain-containing radical SAM protein [Geotalea toluenoxydans]|uniref:B12-binding domain-containing radical SAM protein n=1 Tax=Geotalea toluenoxydans TaxID=421624 RepID=UPI0006D0C122|nr:B12-binding domain-containing radical SAM protein [Geotalea toluenoxydans]